MWYIGTIPIVERNYGLVFSVFFFTSLAALVVGMRTYTRAFLVKNVGADDVLMIIALVRSFFYQGKRYRETNPGASR